MYTDFNGEVHERVSFSSDCLVFYEFKGEGFVSMDDIDSFSEGEWSEDSFEEDYEKVKNIAMSLTSYPLTFEFYKNGSKTERERIDSCLPSNKDVKHVIISQLKGFYGNDKSGIVYDGYTFKRNKYLLLKRNNFARFFDSFVETTRLDGIFLDEFSIRDELEKNFKQRIKDNFNRDSHSIFRNKDGREFKVLNLDIEHFQLCIYLATYIDDLKNKKILLRIPNIFPTQNEIDRGKENTMKDFIIKDGIDFDIFLKDDILLNVYDKENYNIALVPIISRNHASLMVVDIKNRKQYLFDSSMFHVNNLNIIFGKDIIGSIVTAKKEFIPFQSESGTCTSWILAFVLTANSLGCDSVLDFMKKLTNDVSMDYLKDDEFMFLMFKDVSNIIDGTIIDAYNPKDINSNSYCISKDWLKIFNEKKQQVILIEQQSNLFIELFKSLKNAPDTVNTLKELYSKSYTLVKNQLPNATPNVVNGIILTLNSHDIPPLYRNYILLGGLKGLQQNPELLKNVLQYLLDNDNLRQGIINGMIVKGMTGQEKNNSFIESELGKKIIEILQKEEQRAIK